MFSLCPKIANVATWRESEVEYLLSGQLHISPDFYQLTSHLTFNRSFNLSEPLFPHFEWVNNTIFSSKNDYGNQIYIIHKCVLEIIKCHVNLWYFPTWFIYTVILLVYNLDLLLKTVVFFPFLFKRMTILKRNIYVHILYYSWCFW